jgi:triosephosphate isomerase
LGDTDEIIATKVCRSLETDLAVVLCVGELRDDRNLGNALSVVCNQVRFALATIASKDAARIIIAYEPVWAVGSDETPTSEEIREMIFGIREVLRQVFGDDSESVRILYGGSVRSENIRKLTIDAGADGALVGRASLDVEEFFDMINKMI